MSWLFKLESIHYENLMFREMYKYVNAVGKKRQAKWGSIEVSWISLIAGQDGGVQHGVRSLLPTGTFRRFEKGHIHASK